MRTPRDAPLTSPVALCGCVCVCVCVCVDAQDRYAFAIAASRMESELGYGKVEYTLLAGPIFVAVYSVTGIGTGYLADRSRRTLLLAALLAGWSTVTLLVGFAESFWQVALLRAGQGLCEAGCTPLANGLIGDFFPPHQRGAALGVYNWGIYMGTLPSHSGTPTFTRSAVGSVCCFLGPGAVRCCVDRCSATAGYGAAYGVGNYISHEWGWRWMFKLFGAPGVLLALVLASVKEPRRGRTEPGASPPLRTPTSRTARTRSAGSSKGMSARRVVDLRRHAGGGSGSGSGGGGDDDSNDWAQRRADRDSTYVPPSLRPATPGEIARYWCSAKALLLLCVAGAVRNAGGYVWAYNTELFFENVRGETPSEIAVYMGWIPLVGGSLGAVVGGVISDKVVKRGTVSDRLWVLIISQVRATPALWSAVARSTSLSHHLCVCSCVQRRFLRVRCYCLCRGRTCRSSRATSSARCGWACAWPW